MRACPKRIFPLKNKGIISNLKALKRLINSIYPQKCCKKIIIISNIRQDQTINEISQYWSTVSCNFFSYHSKINSISKTLK